MLALVFELFINIWESMALSFFVGYYLDLEKKNYYGLIIGLGLATTITLENYLYPMNMGSVLPLLLIFMLAVSASYLKRDLSLSVIFISGISVLILLCCNSIALFLSRTLFNASGYEIVTRDDYIQAIIAIMLSKTLLSIIFYTWCKYKVNMDNKIKLSKWWMLVFVIFILLLLLEILFIMLVYGELVLKQVYYALLIVIVVIFFIIYLFYKLHREYEETITIKIKMQDMENRKRNYDLISMVNKDLERNMHNSKYFLMRLQHKLLDEDLDGANELVNQRLEKELYSRRAISTGNYYFDYSMNYNLQRYKIKHNPIKLTVLVDKCDTIESREFTDFCCRIISFIKEDKESSFNSFDMQQLDNYIRIKLLLSRDANKETRWRKFINQLLDFFTFTYEIEYVNDLLGVYFLIEK